MYAFLILIAVIVLVAVAWGEQIPVTITLGGDAPIRYLRGYFPAVYQVAKIKGFYIFDFRTGVTGILPKALRGTKGLLRVNGEVGVKFINAFCRSAKLSYFRIGKLLRLVILLPAPNIEQIPNELVIFYGAVSAEAPMPTQYGRILGIEQTITPPRRGFVSLLPPATNS